MTTLRMTIQLQAARLDEKGINMTTQYFIQHEDKLLNYNLKRSDRKTIEISVHPDKSIIVRAPRKTSRKELDKLLQKKTNWIIKKLRYYENIEPRNKTKHYTDGEEHIYLGRPYRLKIISGTANEVELSGDRLVISCIEEPYSEKVKQLLEGWYWTKAEKSFTGYIEKWWPLFEKKGFNTPRLRIKKMKTRWGSLSTKGNLSLNVDLIKAPEECIEYLVVHELCHLEQHNHGPDFYRLLEELIPNWREKKQDLEKALMFNRSF